ncbi:hypothetical protein Y032_0061g3285 [Ancylostoma ceylanicum]|uniref:Uncharacterized protein n=2 Tax=Ancylostoma ceylanicum TaxID=53326 RepID=A0A016U371_9BILA|nr:hypothetical protein Y032_0061g3285 [Ancylostoma ceylanicum]
MRRFAPSLPVMSSFHLFDHDDRALSTIDLGSEFCLSFPNSCKSNQKVDMYCCWSQNFITIMSTFLCISVFEVSRKRYYSVDSLSREETEAALERPGCYNSNISANIAHEFESMQKEPRKALAHYKAHFVEPPSDKILDRPCFDAIAEAVESLIVASCKWIMFLAVLTIIMTVLVIVILLYNSGQGELLPHLNRVRSPHRNPLVWFFIKMDGEENKFNDEDLTDFSIIQELKEFDIDKDLTDIE